MIKLDIAKNIHSSAEADISSTRLKYGLEPLAGIGEAEFQSLAQIDVPLEDRDNMEFWANVYFGSNK